LNPSLYQVTIAGGTIQKIGQLLSGFTKKLGLPGDFSGLIIPILLARNGWFWNSRCCFDATFGQRRILANLPHGSNKHWQSWCVSFGSMVTSILTMEAVTGLPVNAFSNTAAALLGITEIFSGLIVVFLQGARGTSFAPYH